MKKMIIAAVAATSLLTSTAFAAVTFDPATGAGTVGKGDVQLAFGWNNKLLQANADKVSFKYSVLSKYTMVCEYETVSRTKGTEIKTKDLKTTVGINSRIDWDPRVKNQIVGFILNDYVSNAPIEEAPEVGDACTAQNIEGELIAVNLDSQQGDGLTVQYQSQEVALTPTA